VEACRPGEVIVRRELWRGRVYSAMPVIVVRDDPELLAVWWDETWADWEPDPDWPPPLLPGGWEHAG